jgi:hypothetical protein
MLKANKLAKMCWAAFLTIILIGMGIDRSNWPYYLLAMKANGVVVTESYLSSVRQELCMSARVKILNDVGSIKGYLVLAIDVGAMPEFSTGNSRRVYFEP